MGKNNFLFFLGETEVALGIFCGASGMAGKVMLGAVFVVPVVEEIIMKQGAFGK